MTAPTDIDDLRCQECRWANGHGKGCSVGIEAGRKAAERLELRRHANRHWVRALIVAAAERTAGGCGQRYAPCDVTFSFRTVEVDQ